MARVSIETPLNMARRHVAETEADAARLRAILWQMQASNHPNAAEAAQRMLKSTESILSTLRDNLRLEEQRSGAP